MSDLVTHLAQRVYPALFERLDQAFPEFGWRRTASGWVATNRDFTKSRLGARPDRVICHEPFGFLVHGGAPQTWLAYVNGGTRPTGRDFVAAVSTLEARAGTRAEGRPHPRRPRAARRVGFTTRSAAELIAATRDDLAGKRGEPARDHLSSRGINGSTLDAWGLYVGWEHVERRVAPDLCDELRAIVAGSGSDRIWRGRVLIPWRNAEGRVESVIGYRPDGGGPRYLYGPGARPSLFSLERAVASGRAIENLILVEGIFDALQLHQVGFESVAALGGTAFSACLIEELERLRVLSVTLALDGDEPGREATRSILRAFQAARSTISVDVLEAAQLRGCKDPDELVRKHGREAILKALASRTPGSLCIAAEILNADARSESGCRPAGAIEEMVAVYAWLPDTERGRAERRELLAFLAQRTGAARSDLTKEFESALRKARKESLASAVAAALRRASIGLQREVDPCDVARGLRAELASLLRVNAQ